MPVMLGSDDYTDWLDPETEIDNPERFFEPRLSASLLLAPLDKAINNARNKDLALLQPLDEEQLVKG